jgi:hypothetical protein
MPRLFQCLLLVTASLLAWLLMQAVHELGHLAAAWATGGVVERVVLHPLTISRTDVEPNPQPLIVAWGGPVIGILAPLAFWASASAARLPAAWLTRYFAGFCLLANGFYIGVGSFDKVGDAGDLLAGGSPRWTLWLFGLVTAPTGLALWNGLGPHFGIGRDAPPVKPRIAILLATAFLLVALVECLLFTR